VHRCRLLLFALFVQCVSVSCGAEQSSVQAKSCFVIEADNSKQRTLRVYFDRFAAKHKLAGASDAKQEGAFGYVYRDPLKGVLVSLNLYMGDLRAAASLYTDEDDDCAICQPFEDFLRNDVGKDLKVTACADVYGFRPPTLLNFDLHEG
jgi:hypothetical protein